MNRGSVSLVSQSLPTSSGKTSTYIAGLDGLRAAAVGLVLVAHAGYDNIVPGGLGVTLFFAISGFLISTILLEEYDINKKINFKGFYVRRFLRLYPELIFLIFLCLIAGIFLKWETNALEILSIIAYFMNYYQLLRDSQAVNLYFPWQQTWSLAIEEHFYLIFPLFICLFSKRKNQLLSIVVMLITLPLIWRFISYYIIKSSVKYTYIATECRIDSIAWGCLLAIIANIYRSKNRTMQELLFIRPAALWLGVILIIFSVLYRPEEFRWTWRFSLQGLAIFLIMSNLIFDSFWVKFLNILEFPPIRFIGRISYGLYLYHMLVNDIILQFLPVRNFLFLPVSIIISVAVASLSYRIIEVPLKPLRRKLGSHVR